MNAHRHPKLTVGLFAFNCVMYLVVLPPMILRLLS